MKLCLTFLSIAFTVFAVSASGISKDQYIDQWKDVAMQQMVEYKIPASITLAQGILESGFGNSDLARYANNHFGIKCHGWTGKKYFKDDDAKQECFRSYKHASESYRDHSLFLTGRTRYNDLFNLEITDYKAWAKGLKKAGYATHPKYAEMLIELIEKHELFRFDEQALGGKDTGKKQVKPVFKSPEMESKDSGQAHSNARRVEYRNKVKCVVAQRGDTYYRIAKEFEMSLWQLYRYNDFDAKKDVLSPGDIVYLQPKKGKSMVKQDKLVADGARSLRDYSQEYGVKFEKILKKNRTSDTEFVPAKGAMVFLK
jgi:LysM repeat protein